MRVPTDAWVVVADGEKFLLLRNHGDADLLDLRVIEATEIANPPTRDQGAERPGRVNDYAGRRSAVEQTDWHRLEKQRFVREAADKLRGWAREDRFSDLVVVADPRTLGALRAAFEADAAIATRLRAELGKDLANAPIEEIEKAIRAL